MRPELLHRRRDGAVGEIVLNRPKQLNALSAQLLEELIDAAEWFDTEPEIKAVVVRGAGRAFTAGSDLTAIGRSASEIDGGESPRRALDLGRRMVDAIAGMRALTVAAIHGHCVGGGVVLAAACDIRIAADDARFAIPELELGIPLTWGGIPRLVRELGPALTKDLVLTCRAFDAEEARRIRFVSRLVALDQLETEARTIAGKLASQPGYSLFLTKRAINAVAEESGTTAQTHREVEALIEALQDDESLKVMASYLAARAARRRT